MTCERLVLVPRCAPNVRRLDAAQRVSRIPTSITHRAAGAPWIDGRTRKNKTGLKTKTKQKCDTTSRTSQSVCAHLEFLKRMRKHAPGFLGRQVSEWFAEGVPVLFFFVVLACTGDTPRSLPGYNESLVGD